MINVHCKALSAPKKENTSKIINEEIYFFVASSPRHTI